MVCLVVLLLLPGWGSQIAAQNLSLDEVLRRVVDQNPSLEAARLKAAALAQHRPQVTALPDPSIAVTYQPLPVLTARGAQRSQWRVGQRIPYPGKRRLQGDIADLEAETAQHETEVLAADLVLQARLAYYHLHHMQHLEDLTVVFQEELRSFEEAAAVRYEVAQGAQQAVLRAQLEKNQVAQRLIELQTLKRSAAETLARLMNAPGRIWEVQGDHLEPPPLPDLEAVRLLETARRERPEEAAFNADLQQAERRIDLARKQALPDFEVNLTYFDIASGDLLLTATGRDAVAVGVSVNVPIQRGRLRAQQAEARIQQAEVEARQEAFRTQVQTEIDNLLFTIEQERATLDLYRTTLLPQAETTVEATLASYSTGRTDFLTLLDSERALYTLRVGHADALMRYLAAIAQLERNVGITLFAPHSTEHEHH